MFAIANCIYFFILIASSKYQSIENIDVPSVSVMNNSTSRNRIIEPLENSVTNHDYFLVTDAIRLSTCSQSIVVYTAGFAVFKLGNSLHYGTCISALNTSSKHEQYALINLKTKGALIFPSKDVLNICILCEKLFSINVEHNNSFLVICKVPCNFAVNIENMFFFIN